MPQGKNVSFTICFLSEKKQQHSRVAVLRHKLPSTFDAENTVCHHNLLWTDRIVFPTRCKEVLICSSFQSGSKVEFHIIRRHFHSKKYSWDPAQYSEKLWQLCWAPHIFTFPTIFHHVIPNNQWILCPVLWVLTSTQWTTSTPCRFKQNWTLQKATQTEKHLARLSLFLLLFKNFPDLWNMVKKVRLVQESIWYALFLPLSLAYIGTKLQGHECDTCVLTH